MLAGVVCIKGNAMRNLMTNFETWWRE